MNNMVQHSAFKLFYEKLNLLTTKGIIPLLDEILLDSPDNCSAIYLSWDDTARLILDEHVHLPVETKIALLKLLTDAFIEYNENIMDDIRADIILNHYNNTEPLTPEGEEWIRKLLQLMYTL